MKLLIAAEGTSLDSSIARRFGHARFFLTVDTETTVISTVYEGGSMMRNDILRSAAQEGARTVVSGNIGPHAFAALSTNDMQAVLARGMTVGMAVERFLDGALHTLDAPTLRLALEEHEQHRIEHRRQFLRRSGTSRGRSPFTATTPRGRHHLQQFAGRGH